MPAALVVAVAVGVVAAFVAGAVTIGYGSRPRREDRLNTKAGAPTDMLVPGAVLCPGAGSPQAERIPVPAAGAWRAPSCGMCLAIGEMCWREWGHAPEPEDLTWWVEVAAREAVRDRL